MEYGEVRLRRGEQRNLIAGLSWVYDNQVAWVDDACADGGIVKVTGSDKTFYGLGFFNSKSKIVVRLLTRKQEDITEETIKTRMEKAWERRQALGFSNACRVVFGEADGLPGLTIDKFGDYLSFQNVCLGMESYEQTIIHSLVDIFHPKGIARRNDVAQRQKEGLPLVSDCAYGELSDAVPFMENRAKMTANLLTGQKTGHFLDQQENRGRIAPYCKDAAVLDLCCHTGGFSIHAALFGAKSVKSVDVSKDALDMLMHNAKLNGVENTITPVCTDVFELVKNESEAGEQYDLVICDPPAFTKSRKTLDNAYRGYKELNLRCMKLTKEGGYLATFSCSQFMTAPLFLQMLREAAADSGREVQLLETLMQSRDHAASFSTETSWYLKGYIVRVI